MNNIIMNCPLCEEHSLHIIGEKDLETQQCINCGYASSFKFIGNKEDNEMYKSLPEEMKSWSKEKNDRIWIPSMITLPFGTLYPINIDGEMKWASAEMIDIPEDEWEKYPIENGEGFYKQRYDTENQKIFDEFILAMSDMNEKAKQNSVPESKIKMPKLKKID